MSLIILEIVTPDSIAFSEEVDHVVVPTVNGKIDILEKHIPIIDRVIPGDIKIKWNGQEKFLAVGSGFVEVYGNKVSIITDQALDVSKEDESVIDEAIARAKTSLEEGKKSNLDQAQIELLEAAARFEMAKRLPEKSLVENLYSSTQYQFYRLITHFSNINHWPRAWFPIGLKKLSLTLAILHRLALIRVSFIYRAQMKYYKSSLPNEKKSRTRTRSS